jgi:colanic acid biosynthesis glycosyl transferase WcaI
VTTLLYSGNLGLGQDLGTVIRAVAQLNGDGALRVLVVGSGKGLPAIRRLVSELALHSVEFRDPVPLYQLPDLMAQGDIHVICQKPGTEGLLVPSKIYGTLAVGRPVVFIGPGHCEVAQIVRDSGCGFVVTSGDVESAARVLRILALDAALRREMGEHAKMYYASNFGRRRSVTQIIGLIERVARSGW